MEIKILFDSDGSNRRFLTGWGVSYLIDGRILFDTSDKSSSLFRNMKNLDVDISNLKTVVISHDHWDHRGGLWGVLKGNPKLKVYACPNFSRRFKNKVKSCGGQLIEAGKFTSITRNVYTTGEIVGTYAGRYMPEQAVAIKTRKGMTILTGCAHPGIIKIIENVKQNISGNIYLVLGGFHLMGRHKKTIKPIIDKFKRLNIKKVAPTHCTGKGACDLFKKRYRDNLVEVKVGQILNI